VITKGKFLLLNVERGTLPRSRGIALLTASRISSEVNGGYVKVVHCDIQVNVALYSSLEPSLIRKQFQNTVKHALLLRIPS
jgi:hypothetical protein